MNREFTIRRYPLSTLTLAVVLILSFMPIPETPLSDVAFIDKWTHIVMYAGLSGVIWFEYFRNHGLRFNPFPYGIHFAEVNARTLHLSAVIFPFILGGVIEILQENCTNHVRSGDWLDWIADAVGVLIAGVIFAIFIHFVKGNKD